jgi:hypothetical protein
MTLTAVLSHSRRAVVAHLLALFRGGAPPDSGQLSRSEGEIQTLRTDRAATTHFLRLGYGGPQIRKEETSSYAETVGRSEPTIIGGQTRMGALFHCVTSSRLLEQRRNYKDVI